MDIEYLNMITYKISKRNIFSLGIFHIVYIKNSQGTVVFDLIIFEFFFKSSITSVVTCPPLALKFVLEL